MLYDYPTIETPPQTKCYHCGEDCNDEHIKYEEKDFCCDGCKTVYEILNRNNLCTYYALDGEKRPIGVSMKNVRPDKFAYLDNPDIAQQLIKYSDEQQTHVSFYIPHIHCHSCIWLLENLHTIESGVLQSEVNFPRKELRVIFDNKRLSLRKVAELSTAVGYEPYISLQDISNKNADNKERPNRSHLYKIGIAGFAFANIMLLSLPEYFSWGNFYDMPNLKQFFGLFNLFLTLPVFFYSASDFFTSAYKSIRFRFLNIDAPIALAILVTFLRSLYEVFTQTGAGYFDSLTGIVFFMLIGRYFQQKTYDTLSFERDYKSYFPVAVLRKQSGGKEAQVPVNQLKIGDKILIHNNEIVPADALLYKGTAYLDYSFVTGEAKPIRKEAGEIVYAGGRHLGSNIELEVIKEVSQSYLTQLWNNSRLKSAQVDNNKPVFTDTINRYFTGFILSLAMLVLAFWLLRQEPTRALHAFTAVLIIACPCTLLLSASFTSGNLLRILGKNKFYLKNNSIIEQMANISAVVFDKTGTLTQANAAQIAYEGAELSTTEKHKILMLVAQSNHPLSRKIATYLQQQIPNIPTTTSNAAAHNLLDVQDFAEWAGRGLEAKIGGDWIKVGASQWLNTTNRAAAEQENTPTIAKETATVVHVNINGQSKGRFCLKHSYRPQLANMVHLLQKKYRTYLLSGDNDAEKKQLSSIFGADQQMLFNRKPDEKLNFIADLQQKNERVMMVGDGLNDAGALLQSDVGIAVSDDTNNFSPACDAILDGSQFGLLPAFIRLARAGRSIIRLSFALSLLYNAVGLYFALQGTLQPVIAAILMPLSSTTIILFTFLSTNLTARRLGLE